MTRRRFPWTGLLYGLLAVHAVILCVGGHYTYARVPFGDWMQDVLGTERNPYDRLGHLAQGFIPAIAFREMLLRATPLRKGKTVFFLVVACCLAVSALYELVEWLTSLTAGDASLEFLGVQGDIWDAQADMLFALVGAILAQLLLGRLHDRCDRAPDGEAPRLNASYRSSDAGIRPAHGPSPQTSGIDVRDRRQGSSSSRQSHERA